MDTSRLALLGSLAMLAVVPAARADLPDRARTSRDADTRRLEFVGTPPGRPIARPDGLSPSSAPQAVGRAFLEGNSKPFGLGRGSDLRTLATNRLPGGVKAVRYQQTLSGVEVLGGQFTVQLDRQNNVLSAIGEAEPRDSFDTWPSLSGGEAEERARVSTARVAGVEEDVLDARVDGLRIYDSRILGSPGLERQSLVWAVEVDDGAAVRRLVLVDARLGVIVESIDRNPHAKDRSVCDAENADDDYPCTAPVRSEGDAATGNADVDDVYDYAGATYDYFFSTFGRDSLDDAGLALKSTVRYCPTGDPCPYENAFWDGEQMVYGEGFASADDVVGHELAHGFTEFTSHLYYAYQSGAINESMSDVFGEIIDQLTASPDDDPADEWLLGESLPIGAIRDMKNPGAFGDPDSMTSGDYWTFAADNGGVHMNSGVNNRAAFLIADGIGLEKMGRLYYAVSTSYLVSASDFNDLGNALGQACDNLVGSAGFTAADCVEVRDAVAETEMLTERPEATDEPECLWGDPTYLFEDDLEGASQWTPAGQWYLPQNTHPYAFDATWATSGVQNMWGYDQSTLGDFSITQNADVAIPAEAFLSFQHANLFEFTGATSYDGGVVEASTDGGSGWIDIGTGDYNGSISAVDGNPLAGRAAFTGHTGYRRTVISLAALEGENARVRFRIGTDGFVDDYGWFIDDIRIVTCPTGPSASTDAPGAVDQSSAVLNGTVNPNDNETSYQFEWGPTTSYGNTAPGVPASVGSGGDAVAVTQTLSGLAAGTTYNYRVVAVRGSQRLNGVNATFTTSSPPPPPAPPTAADPTAAPAPPGPVATTLPAASVTSSTAALTGAVNPAGSATSYQFEWGATTAYGNVAPAAPSSVGSGAAEVQVSQPLAGLAADSTYHYRVVAVRGSVRTPGENMTFATRAAPVSEELVDVISPTLRRPGIRPKRFRAARTGASIAGRRAQVGGLVTYGLSRAADVVFRVKRVRPGGRLRAVGRFSHRGDDGVNSFTFTGRVDGEKLTSGRYKLVAQAEDLAGNKSNRTRRGFRIVSR